MKHLRSWLGESRLHASERIWCAYFLLMAVSAEGGRLSLGLLGLTLAVWLLARSVALRWRLLAGLVWVNFAYALGSDVARSLRATRFDAALTRIDGVLGWHASAWTPSAFALDALSCFYLSFYVLLFAGFLVFRRRPAFHTGLAAIYGIGTFCYVLVPAAGPFFTWPLPVEGTHVFARLQPFASRLVTGVDVFPSLHVAVSGYVLAWLTRRWPRAWPLFALWAAAVAAATVGLRYHYLIDVVGGVALVGSVLFLQQLGRRSATPARLPSLGHERIEHA